MVNLFIFAVLLGKNSKGNNMIELNSKGRTIKSNKPLVMGVLNCTEDSFYEASRTAHYPAICKRIDDLISSGVDIIDIGGKSTKPGSMDIAAAVEIERISDAIQYLVNQKSRIWSSIDTTNAEVAQYAVDNGIDIVNDAIGEWNTGEIASSISVDTPGIYSITVSNGPCSTIDGTTVIAMTIPELTTLEEVYTLCDLETSFRLEVDSLPGVQYEWSSSPTTNHYSYVGRGSNWIEVSNTCGVNHYDFIVEEITCSSGLYIPTAFSPNKDQMNDAFQVFGYNISNYEIVIYNHFGDALWTSKNLNDQWILDPNIDPIGSYTYRAEYIDYMGEMRVKYGSITVVK
jgi:gliding motility-associated-like protein